MQQLQQQMRTQLLQIEAQQQMLQQLQDRLNGMSSTVDKQQEDLSAVKTAQQKPPPVPVDGWRPASSTTTQGSSPPTRRAAR